MDNQRRNNAFDIGSKFTKNCAVELSLVPDKCMLCNYVAIVFFTFPLQERWEKKAKISNSEPRVAKANFQKIRGRHDQSMRV